MGSNTKSPNDPLEEQPQQIEITNDSTTSNAPSTGATTILSSTNIYDDCNDEISYRNTNESQQQTSVHTGSAARNNEISIRNILGNASIQLSAMINENLILVRYISLITISSLGIYAFINTPLFFRYRNILDIPSYYFTKRKSITGRLILPNQQYTANSSTGSNSTINNHQHQLHSKYPSTLQQSKNNFQQQTHHSSDSVTCYVRHLSPIESLLSPKLLQRYWYWIHRLQSLTNISPSLLSTSTSSTSNNSTNKYNDTNRPEGKLSELIQIQIAGIEYPKIKTTSSTPPRPSATASSTSIPNNPLQQNWNTILSSTNKNNDRHMESLGKNFIHQLSEQQYMVKCQFLARQIPNYDNRTIGDTTVLPSSPSSITKRPIPNMIETTQQIVKHTVTKTIPIHTQLQQHIAIVKLYCYTDPTITKDSDKGLFYYLQRLFQRLYDVGQSMILNGYAIVSENGGILPTTTTTTTRIVDTDSSNSRKIQDIQYINQLTKMEYNAAQQYNGIWNSIHYRNQRFDIVQEVEFQQHSTIIQKIFRWIRGG